MTWWTQLITALCYLTLATTICVLLVNRRTHYRPITKAGSLGYVGYLLLLAYTTFYGPSWVTIILKTVGAVLLLPILMWVFIKWFRAGDPIVLTNTLPVKPIPKVTYLLVEDEPEQASIMQKWLVKLGQPDAVEVIICDNMECAIETSSRIRPNATFCDLLISQTKNGPKLGVDDWRQTADKLDQLVEPVIVVTGLDVTFEMKSYCIKKGAQHVFRKPFDSSFFHKLTSDTKIFAAKLIEAAGDAEFRAKLGPKQDGS